MTETFNSALREQRDSENGRVHDGQIVPPVGCPRGLLGQCSPLSRVSSPNFESYFCCGETDAAPVPTDRLRFCVFSSHDNGPVNVMVNFDERDAGDAAFVLLGGLSVFAADRAVAAYKAEAEARAVAPVAPDGSRLRGYYPGVECEHGYDACPKCDAIDPSPSQSERADPSPSELSPTLRREPQK